MAAMVPAAAAGTRLVAANAVAGAAARGVGANLGVPAVGAVAGMPVADPASVPSYEEVEARRRRGARSPGRAKGLSPVAKKAWRDRRDAAAGDAAGHGAEEGAGEEEVVADVEAEVEAEAAVDEGDEGVAQGGKTEAVHESLGMERGASHVGAALEMRAPRGAGIRRKPRASRPLFGSSAAQRAEQLKAASMSAPAVPVPAGERPSLVAPLTAHEYLRPVSAAEVLREAGAMNNVVSRGEKAFGLNGPSASIGGGAAQGIATSSGVRGGAGVKQAATASFAPRGASHRASSVQAAALAPASDVATLQRMSNMDTVPSPEIAKGPRFSTDGGGGGFSGGGNDDAGRWGRGDGSDSDSDVEDEGGDGDFAEKLGAMLEGAVADARRRVARLPRFEPGDRTATLMNMGGAALTFGGGVELGYRMPRNFVPAHDNVLLDADGEGDIERGSLAEYTDMPHKVLASTHSLVVEEAGRLREENARLEEAKRKHERASLEQRRARDTLSMRIDSLEEMNQKLLNQISKDSLDRDAEKGLGALKEAMAEAARLRSENERLRRRVESGISAFMDPKVMADDRQALRDGVSRLERYQRSLNTAPEGTEEPSARVQERAPATYREEAPAASREEAPAALRKEERTLSHSSGLETIAFPERLAESAPSASLSGEAAAPVPALRRAAAAPSAPAAAPVDDAPLSPYHKRMAVIASATDRMSAALKDDSDEIEILSRRVQENDTLYRIAQAVYGEGAMWPVIIEANPHMSRDQSDYIYAGDMLNIPVPSRGSSLARDVRDTLSVFEA